TFTSRRHGRRGRRPPGAAEPDRGAGPAPGPETARGIEVGPGPAPAPSGPVTARVRWSAGMRAVADAPPHAPQAVADAAGDQGDAAGGHADVALHQRAAAAGLRRVGRCGGGPAEDRDVGDAVQAV